MSVQRVNHDELEELIIKAYRKQVALFIQGPTGVGKSYTVREAARALAKELGLKGVKEWPDFDVEHFNVVDIRLSQLDPVDLRGLPQGKDGKLTWLPPDFLGLPQDARGIYFFDELNLAPPLVQSSFYSIALDRRAGNVRLPGGMSVIGAGNRLEDKANIFEMAAPLANRFGHAELQVPTEEAWTNWAMEHGVDSRIVGFIKQNPSFLYRFPEDPSVKAFPTPRAWAEFCSPMIVGETDLDKVQFYASAAVGPATAAQFMAFVRLTAQIDIDSVWRQPEKATLPKQPAELYALTSALSERFRNKPEEKALEKVMCISMRLPAEFGVLLLRMVKPLIPEKLDPKVKPLMRKTGVADHFGKYLLPQTG